MNFCWADNSGDQEWGVFRGTSTASAVDHFLLHLSSTEWFGKWIQGLRPKAWIPGKNQLTSASYCLSSCEVSMVQTWKIVGFTPPAPPQKKPSKKWAVVLCWDCNMSKRNISVCAFWVKPGTFSSWTKTWIHTWLQVGINGFPWRPWQKL